MAGVLTALIWGPALARERDCTEKKRPTLIPSGSSPQTRVQVRGGYTNEYPQARLRTTLHYTTPHRRLLSPHRLRLLHPIPSSRPLHNQSDREHKGTLDTIVVPLTFRMPLQCSLPGIAAVKPLWHRWEQTVAAVRGAAPVASIDIAPVFPADTYPRYGGSNTARRQRRSVPRIHDQTGPRFSHLRQITI